MQKKYSNILLASLALLSVTARAQETIYPAKAQKGVTVITHATVHVGNGTVLNDASVSFENGKITAVGNITPAAGATVIDATKQVCKDCKMEIKWGNRYDQVFFNKTGRCQECVAKFESKLRLEGTFEDYEKKKVFQNQLSISKDLKTKIEESLSFVESNQKISFPNGDGTLDEWTIERRDLIIKDLKKDLKKIDKTILKLQNKIEALNHVE